MKLSNVWVVFCSLALFAFSAGQASAQTDFWDGSNNSNWFNNGNWSLNHEPAITENAQVNVLPLARISDPGATARSLSIGTNSGDTGEVRVTDDGSLTVGAAGNSGPFTVGNGGTGTLILSDMSSTSVVENNLIVGSQSGSNGDVTVRDDATLDIDGQLRVGDSGTGVFKIRDTAMVTANHLDVGTFNGGMGNMDVGNNPGTLGNFTINGNASIGTSGTGILDVHDNGAGIITGTLFIGNNSDGVGTVKVRGESTDGSLASLLDVDQNIDVGVLGDGKLEVRDGGIAQGENIHIGRDSGSTGMVTVTGVGPVSGVGSLLNARNDLSVGGTQVGPGGDGQLRIVDHGVVTVGNNMWVWGPGSGNKGVLAIDSTYTLTVDSTLTFDGGRLHFLEDGVDFVNDAVLGNTQDPSGMFADTDGHTDTISGLLSGPGRLWKRDTGTLILTNDNTFTGRTIVQEGTLQVDGAVGGSLSVRAAGTLTGVYDGVANNVTRNLRNRGIVSPGDNPGDPATFRVGGDFTNHPEGSYFVDVGGLTEGVDADLLFISGGASIEGGTLQVTRINNFSPAPGDRVTILRTDTGRTGEFDTLVPIGWGLIHPVDVYDDPFTVDIVFELSSFTSIAGLTPNQEAVGEALDEAFSDECLPLDVFTFLGNIPMNEVPRALDLIAPEEFTAIYQMSVSYATVRNENLIRRMEDIRVGADGYCAAPNVEVVPSGKDDKNVAMGGKNVVTPVMETQQCRWGFFLNGTGDFAEVDGDFNASGYDTETGSLIAGVDYRIGNHFAIGVSGGYVGGDANLVDDGHIQMSGGRFGGYATVFGKLLGFNVHLDGAVDGGWNSYDTHRTTLSTNFPEDTTAQGNTNSSEFSAMLSTGTDYVWGCWHFGTWSTLQYTKVDLDGFTEHGSLIPLHFPDQDEDSFRSTSGIKVTYDQKWGRTIFRPEARIAYYHEYGDKAYDITANFIDCPTSFTVHGPVLGEDAALVGGGFSVQWNGCLSTYVYYDGVLFRENYNSNAVSGGVRIGF